MERINLNKIASLVGFVKGNTLMTLLWKECAWPWVRFRTTGVISASGLIIHYEPECSSLLLEVEYSIPKLCIRPSPVPGA